MDPLRWLLVILVGYVPGSIPFGYLIVRMMRGIDVRDYGSHNIGATNVLRIVGRGPALLTLLGDVLKGALPPVLAAGPITGGLVEPWAVVVAALAAIAGHAYSLYFLIAEGRFARGKAVATGLGAIIGFTLARQVSPVALLIVALVWAGTVLGPRLLKPRFGFVSLASVLAAISMPVAFVLTGAATAYIVFGVLAAAFVTWKHKENLGRLLDGVEPRLGEQLPLAGIDKKELSCAFMIHAITPDDWFQTRRLAWLGRLAGLGIIPLGVLRRLTLLVRPMKLDTIRGIRTPDGHEVQVHMICVPWLPEDIRRHQDLAVRRCVQTAELARALGARCLGLGAYWSTVGEKGKRVAELAPFIPITNGGAYTAGTVRMAVPMVRSRLLRSGIPLEQAVVAVVGANGVVGFGICRQLLGLVKELIVIGVDTTRVTRSAELLEGRLLRGDLPVRTRLTVSTSMDDCRRARVIFTATSNPQPVLQSRHVAPGTLIYDMGRPSDASPEVQRDENLVYIPGGVVRPPGEMRGRIDCHFGEGQIPACMAETIVMALDECYDRASVGDATRSENIDYLVERAAELGFEVVGEEGKEHQVMPLRAALTAGPGAAAAGA